MAHYVGIAWEWAGRQRVLVLSVSVIWLVTLALVGHMRANSWRSPDVLMETLARHHPESYRSVVGYAFNSIPVETDLSVRFDAFKRAASLDKRVIVPLIEMAKIATALGNFIGSGERVFQSSNGKDTRYPIREMWLSMDGDHNAHLLAALDVEINQRLSTEPVRTDSVVVLVSLVDCALDGNRECAALRANTKRWHDSALFNERLSGNHRAVLELSVAKIHASSGDYDAAVRHAHRAGDSAVDILAYRIQEATLYALLERWDDLVLLLDEIENRFPARASANPAYRNLKEQLERARNR